MFALKVQIKSANLVPLFFVSLCYNFELSCTLSASTHCLAVWMKYSLVYSKCFKLVNRTSTLFIGKWCIATNTRVPLHPIFPT